MKKSMARIDNVYWHHIKPNRTDDMAKLVQDIQSKHETISAVVFDRFYAEEAYSFRIRELCPNAVRILDMQDIHSLRIGRQQLVKEFDQQHTSKTREKAIQLSDELMEKVMKFNPSTHVWTRDNSLNTKAKDTFLRELASIHRSDLVLVCGNAEMKMLKQPSWSVAPWKLIPASFFQTKAGDTRLRNYDERCDFVSIGGFKHPPNVDSVHLLRRIWPRIRSLIPQVKLHIYGAYPTNEIQSMHNEKMGLYVHGHIEDINDALLQRRVLLAPLRFGAGIKGKIVDSWVNGVPVVTTPIGAEGMGHHHHSDEITMERCDWGGLVVSNEDEFLEAAVKLYSSREMWKDSQSKAIDLVNILFNKEQNLLSIDEALCDSIINLEQRRDEDTIGQLLWHQNNRSTEYFSKWIELKETK